MEPRQPPTYKDIQRLTGLSLATISKYFNGRTVLDRNRAAIEAAADQLGYRVNTFASNLRRGTSRTVGVLLPTLANQFHLSVVVEVEKQLRREGIGVLVTSNEGADASSGQEAVDLLLSRRVDGIIGVPAPTDLDALREAQAAGVPVVTVDWWLPGLEADSVSLDNEAAGRTAGRHLLDHGHRRVAVVVGEDSVSSMTGRLAGFRAAVAAAGLPDEPTVRQVPLTVEDGYAAMTALLAADARPTAVFAANYELTIGVLTAINESGLRLGQDISMVGFDAVDLARATRPPLTVVAQPVTETATAAARLIRGRLDGTAPVGSAPVVRRLPGRLLVGGSVADQHD